MRTPERDRLMRDALVALTEAPPLVAQVDAMVDRIGRAEAAPPDDLVGRTFGHRTVVRRARFEQWGETYVCWCTCWGCGGTEVFVRRRDLLAGTARKCRRTR